MTLIEVSDKELYNLVLPYIKKKFSSVEIMNIFGLKPDLNIFEKIEEIRRYEPSKYINVKVNENLYSNIKKYCDSNDITLSSFMSGLCIDYLNENKPKITMYDLIEDLIIHTDLSDYEISITLDLNRNDFTLIFDIRNNYNERKRLKDYEN